METETEKIFTEQLGKLPQEVTDFISSTNWDTDLDEIGELYNLSTDEILAFKREVTLVLVGLVHPDALTQTLEEEVGIKGAVLEALVANVDKKIFSTIRPALIGFFEKEAAEYADENATEEKAPDIAPDNLPTAVEETPMPFMITPTNIPSEGISVPITSEILPKPKTEEAPVHPFEEKMKKVFTAGNQNMNELVINTPSPQVPKAPFPPSSDPYREPIE